ncbi:amino acid permease [Enterobacter hormaechei]|uniref:amino acid permease n=1 Tax=Enterobacter hormaechei TaxID=158836 RepID=UPI003907F17F
MSIQQENMLRKRSANSELGKGLKGRQITMISIGGVIGAGLFVGSSNAIATAGPAVILSYLVAAIIVVLVMQMLGEMATARPDTGSFSSYADQAIGRWAGFTIGWLYWWFYLLVVAIEAIVAGNILSTWIPLPPWCCALAITVVLMVTNCLNVKNFGELEYWLAFIKVASIVLFIIIGLAAILGLVPGSSVSGIHNLWTNGGFAPNGWVAVVSGLLIAMFSFQGSEIVTIAAAESAEPSKNIRKAIRAVVWRLGLFYIGSMFVVVCLVPWNAPGLKVGSYQAVLASMNIPGAASIMQFIVLVAVTSCLNSAIYTSSRMSYSLARRGDAPSSWGRTNTQGVPLKSILSTTAVAVVVLLLNYLAPKSFFDFLLSTSGAIALLMYLVIAVTQICMRKKLTAAGAKLEVKMWFFPWLTYFTISLIAAVMVVMIIFPSYRWELISTLIITAVLTVIGIILQKMQPELSARRSVGPKLK